MKRYYATLLVLSMTLAIPAARPGTVLAGNDVPRMTVDELKARLDDPDLIILDVRQDKDWAASASKIRYAIYADPDAYDEWGAAYPKRQPIVLYCA